MMANRSGHFTSGQFSPTVSFNLDATQFRPSYCMSPLPVDLESPTGPRSPPGYHHAHLQCSNTFTMDLESSPTIYQPQTSPASLPTKSPPSFRRMIPSSVAYEMDMACNYRQYCLSPITSEMEKFFSFPTMSITFMPCVCVPDYPVEEGKPRKICRRCSVTPAAIDRGSSTVAIDNKIEQAMDLVKSHLMFAVREEVEVLKEQIAELIERNNQLEYENGILRAAASAETLAKLAQPRQQPPPSSSS